MTQLVKLGDVAEFIRGITFKPIDVVSSDTSGSVRCMRTKNVQDSIDLSDVWSVDARFVKRSSQYLRAGDVLVSSANSWNLVGKCTWVPELSWPATFGGFVSVLRARPSQIQARYLYRWFSSPRTQATLRSFGRQTTSISNLDLKRVLNMELLLPDFANQHRIAEVLDEADVLLAKQRQSIDLLDSLMKSIFYNLFDERIKFQTECRLQDIAEVVSGITKGRKVLAGVYLRTVPYLAVANVQDMRLNLSNVKTIDASASEIARYRLRKNDILLTEGGDPDKLGRGTLWCEEIPEAIHQNHIFRVRLLDSRVNPVFLNWYIGSSFGKSYFLRSAKQTTGIASINSTQLKNFPLRLPSVPVQEAFADKIAKVKESRAHCEAHLRTLRGLFDSLQAKVFRGEL